MNRIIRAEHANFVPGDHNLKPAELGVALYWRDRETGLPKFDGTNLPEGVDSNVTTPAHISHGRWVADCVTPGCHSAAYVSPDDRRMFCTHCENASTNGKWVKVVFPPAKDWQRIEELLLRRPLPEHRNWFPFETVDAIAQENKNHGVDAS